MSNKTKYVLIETDGYSITTKFYGDYETAFNAMSDRFDELCPEELNDDCEETTSLNAYDAILYANGENVYVWRIVELPKPTSEEVFNLYFRSDKEFRKEDARRLFLTEFLGADEIGEVDEESKAEFKETYGFDFETVWSNDEMFSEMADEFAEAQDCNVAENDTWRDVIRLYLEDLKISLEEREVAKMEEEKEG